MLPVESIVIEEETDEFTNKCSVLIISETIAGSRSLWSSNKSLDKDVMAAETMRGVVPVKPAVTMVKYSLIVARVSLGAPSMSPTRSLEMTTPAFKTVAHGNQEIVYNIVRLLAITALELHHRTGIELKHCTYDLSDLFKP